MSRSAVRVRSSALFYCKERHSPDRIDQGSIEADLVPPCPTNELGKLQTGHLAGAVPPCFRSIYYAPIFVASSTKSSAKTSKAGSAGSGSLPGAYSRGRGT